MKPLTKYQRRKLKEELERLYSLIDDAQNEAEEIQRLLDSDSKKKTKKP